MNLPTMSMSRTEARKKFLEYRHAVQDRQDDELTAIMEGYKQMSLGRTIISMNETLRSTEPVVVTDQRYEQGYGQRNFTAHLPAIAFMRADQTRCFVQRNGKSITFTPKSLSSWGRQPARGLKLVTKDPWTTARPDHDFSAMVPIVPAHLLPKHHLRNYYICWEALWSRSKPLAPEDPALLKRITYDLFVVLATWDLTPLERAVIGITR